MSLSSFARKALVCCLTAAAVPWAIADQASFLPTGGEYAIAGAIPGDQVHPQLSLSVSGGFLVWEDNITDGSGLGISAQQLDGGFSAYYSPFRVNATAAGDQEKPQVSLLKGGGAVFVWQGGRQGYQHIFARFRAANGTWLTTNDVPVSNPAAPLQINPVVATLANSNVVVVWSSYNEFSATSMQDVYGQLFSPTGQKIGGEFLVNQFTAFNQRTPAVAALTGGGFAIAWVSEQQRYAAPASIEFVANLTNRTSVDIYARLFNASGAPVGNEFLANSDLNLCANPSLAGASDGSFMVAWGQKDPGNATNSWDVYARPFSSTGTAGAVVRVNTHLYGDQFAPQISAAGTDYLLVWTSLGQDGSMEGVYGQLLHADGSPSYVEFPVNSTWINKQMHPAIGTDGNGRFLVTWTSFTGLTTSFDLFAQRYLRFGTPLQPMSPPFVYVPFVANNGIYQPQIQVSWPFQAGIDVDHYEVYVDGSSTPAASLTTNIWLMTAADGLAANSSHSFQVAYVTPDTRRSPLSLPASATTWMGFSWYGSIPFEWMAAHYGYDTATWPGLSVPVAPGGPTLLQAFLTGANPTDPGTWLRTSLVRTPQGFFLSWNPQPGLIYQVQTSSNLKSAWSNTGGARFASGNSDWMYVGGDDQSYYRVIRLR